MGDYSAMTLTFAFGGTEANGDYVSTFVENGVTIATVTTTRAAGVPATNADLAAQHAIDINAETDLDDVLATDATDDDVNVTVAFVAGRFITRTHSAPVGATLENVAYSLELDLGSIAFDEGFPANVIRSWCFVNVTETFGAGRTLTIDDSPAAAAVITTVDLNTAGRSCSATTDGGYQPRPELTWTPTATIALGATNTLTQGVVLVEVLFTPNLANVAAA